MQHLFRLSLTLLVGLPTTCTVHSQENSGFTLMRSGKIIAGTAVVQGGQTKIMLGADNYILFSSSQIHKTFKNRQDVFRFKAAITPLTAEKQNSLLQWIVEQENYSFAMDHLQCLQETEIELDFKGWRDILAKRSQKTTPQFELQRKMTHKTEFARLIENHLVLGCGITGCHGEHSTNQFLITENDLHLPLRRRVKNFQNTVSTIDRIGAKVFLEHASQKHGALIKGMYPKATSQYLDIAAWANSLPKETKMRMAARGSTVQIEPPQRPVPPKTVPVLFPQESGDTAAPYRIGKKPPGKEVRHVKDEFDPAKFNGLQERKWSRLHDKVQVSPLPSAPPSRLISPDSTLFKK